MDFILQQIPAFIIIYTLYEISNASHLVNHPTRDACLYLGVKRERVGLPAPSAPAFYIAYSLLHMTRNMFFKGE